MLIAKIIFILHKDFIYSIELIQLVFRNNLLINKKKEGFWTLPFSSFYLLNHQFSSVSVLVGGLLREDFEHIYDFLGKARLSFIVSFLHWYSKDFSPESNIEERLTENQKVLYEYKKFGSAS